MAKHLKICHLQHRSSLTSTPTTAASSASFNFNFSNQLQNDAVSCQGQAAYSSLMGHINFEFLMTL